MKRICIIGPGYPYRGGIAQHTTLMAHHLRKAGYEVLFISFKRQYPKWLYGRDDKDESSNHLQEETEYLIDSLNPVSWIQTIRRIKEWRADTVIIPWWVPFWAPLWRVLSWGIKRSDSTVKLIFMCHNVLPHEESWFDLFALKFGIGRGDGFIVHAESEASKLKIKFPNLPVLVTPMPTYAQIGSQSAEVALLKPNVDLNLLFFGLVRHYKGLDILISAMSLIKSDAHLFVVGDFWDDEAAYRRQIAELGLEPRVTIINEYVSDEVLASYIHQANLVVLPYRDATQSAVVQMALGHGTPVITTDVGGLPEAIEDGKTGFIVPPEDPAALAMAIDRFYVNSADIDFQSHIAKSQQRFSWEIFIQRLSQFVNELVS
jgi:glycosyltransferase involved in cell wall biosynthesis